jgi:quercetin dioxygenase-like cupin family protein
MRRALAVAAAAGVLAFGVLAQESADKMIVGKGATAKFGPAAGLPDCITMAVLRGDPSKGPSVIELKIDTGCVVPWHWHTANETGIPLTGLMQVTMKGEKPVVVANGDYLYLPATHVHQAKCASSKPCIGIFELDAAIDIHYVDKAGAEIPAEKALAEVNKPADRPGAKPAAKPAPKQ